MKVVDQHLLRRDPPHVELSLGSQRGVEMDHDALLHVYGQYLWHDNVQIVGNKAGLVELRDAIDRALTSGAAITGNVFVGDGEGYQVTVARKNAEWEEWDRYLVPYTASYAADKRDDAVDPRHFR